ncbi:N-acetylmuramic acid 6-phosphate etherase [Carnobacteriaceae bacterium zg-ZUI240]|nr:N-acetylmuramic acid 6-phosphate etherase [Carnobacteriaceae bacterium zg-ZUI240]
MDLSVLNTESNNPNTRNIDSVSTQEMLLKINAEDQTVAQVVQLQIPAIAQLIDAAYLAVRQGGRLIYIGAGTSGRLGVLDASECPPTYGVTHDLVQGVIAGGKDAMFKAKEGAEDSKEGAITDLKAIHLVKEDVVVGLAASGRTPYVVGALEYANEIGATTGSVSCVENAQVSKVATYPIEVVTGPEVVMGSTRMKAGTAQKLVLNMISSGLMIKLGKVYQNYMVDVQPTNQKLVVRAMNMIQTLAQVDEHTAQRLFELSGQNVKVAIVMALAQLTKQEAVELLLKSDDRVAVALKEVEG